MANLLLPDIPGSFQRGMQHGTQQRQIREGEQRRNRLADLAAQAYGAAPGQRAPLIQQAIANDPASGFELGQSLRTDEDGRNQSLVNMARMLTTAPEQYRPGLYQQMAPQLQRMGLQGLPPQYDDSVAQTAAALVQAYSGGEAGNVIHSQRVLADGRIMNTYRDGRTEVTDHEADIQSWMRDHPGMEPHLVRRSGEVVPVGGQEQGAPGVTTFNGPDGMPVQIGDDVPDHVRQSILANPQGWNAAPDGAAAALPPAQVGQMPQGGPAASPALLAGVPVRPTEAQIAGESEAARIRAGLALAPDVAAAAAQERAAVTQAEGTTKAGVGYLDDLNDRASKAGTEEARLQQLEYALSRTYSGFGAEQLLTLRQIGGAFGIGDAESLSAGELARSISNQLALGLRNPAGGEGMPGNMSNDDRRFLEQTVPRLQNSPDGWRQMIDMRRRLNQYALQQAQEANRYLGAGGSAEGLRRHMAQWAEQNPLFAAPAPAQGGRRTLPGEVTGVADAARNGTRAAAPSDYPDARQAPDGHWYVQRNGRWFIVEDD